MSHVVRINSHYSSICTSISPILKASPANAIFSRHASIDPKIRKERNLPEHLIRLCVGIEDPDDLLDDLESALLQAGAVSIVDDSEYQGEQRIERVPLASEGIEEGLAMGITAVSLTNDVEIPNFITSAPGKVILFGEHAVVHGMVSMQLFSLV